METYRTVLKLLHALISGEESLSVNLSGEGGTTPTADARNGKLSRVRLTVTTSVTTIAVPDYAQGFVIYSAGQQCAFAVGENPGAIATALTGTTIGSGDLLVGNVIVAAETTARLLEAGTDRDLRVRAAASTEVIVSFF